MTLGLSTSIAVWATVRATHDGVHGFVDILDLSIVHVDVRLQKELAMYGYQVTVNDVVASNCGCALGKVDLLQDCTA